MTNLEKLGHLRIEFQVQFPTKDRVLIFMSHGLPDFVIQPPRSCLETFMAKQRRRKESDPEKDAHGFDKNGNMFGAGTGLERAAEGLLIELRHMFQESEEFLAQYAAEFAAVRVLFEMK